MEILHKVPNNLQKKQTSLGLANLKSLKRLRVTNISSPWFHKYI